MVVLNVSWCGIRLRASPNVSHARWCLRPCASIPWSRLSCVPRYLARGGSVIQRPSPLNALKDTYDHSCY
jgi:hypothetical protein